MTISSYAVDLATRLIRCQSVTPVEGGAMKILAKELGPLGFDCIWLPSVGGKSGPKFICKTRENGPHFAFAGHTDVVPVVDASDWSHAPFSGARRWQVIWPRCR